MKYFPVFFDLAGQNVLVVGGGEIASRKIALLERCGAAITVVAPEIAPDVAARGAAGSIQIVRREFAPSDLEGVRLVIVATSRRAINRWIATLSEARAIPVNVVDDREASRFIVPAIVDRDPVVIAVSTGGASPVLARRLRERLEASIPKRLGAFALWLRELRRVSLHRLRDINERRRFFETIVDGTAGQRFMAGDERGAQRIAQGLLAKTAAAPAARGSVALVGAGPGDPELLTLKALRALQDADVILHDRLVADAILDYARRDASLICVGKTAGGSSTAQSDINALLIRHAAEGKRVVRLKGGDPFIFGRGGEELEALAGAHIDFSVIPGITAAAGCAAYAGIPLTHREHAHSVAFVTGHAGTNGKEPDWRTLARPGGTIVFYMALGRLDHIALKLREHGAAASLPAALVTHGTLPHQRVVTATLETLVEAAAAADVGSPALLIVGEVVRLRTQLSWFAQTLTADVSRSA
ncbi:MAG: siroheme synthase CysG [Steroidobacteraceae bacterium]